MLGKILDQLKDMIEESDWLADIRYDEYMKGYADGFKEGAGDE